MTGQLMMTVADYCAEHGVVERTVRRWLSAGELPDAVQDSRGRWRIPVDAEHTSTAAASPSPVRSSGPGAVSIGTVLDRSPVLLGVAEAAALLGISEHAVRRNRELFGLLPVGPHGSLVMPQANLRRLAGL